MSRPLSIGISCYPGATVAGEIGLALARAGHNVHFVCTDSPVRPDPERTNVQVHRVKARDLPNAPHLPYALAFASKLVQVAQTEGLDVIHAHCAVPHATSAWMASEILGAAGPRVVTTLYGTDLTRVDTDESSLAVTAHSLMRSSAITAPSKFLRAQASERLGLDLDRNPVDVIPNFVDTSVYRPPDTAERPELTALFGPAALDLPVLVHTSDFRPVKRVEQVVAAFERVLERQQALLVLIGDGPERGAVVAALRDRRLMDRVRMIGTQTGVAPLLRECDVFLLPSLTEGFGLSALEAMASGVPVVGSDVGGLPELVTHGKTGFLAPVHDLQALSERTVQLLIDPGLRDRMGAAARADAVARYEPGPQIDRYLALYERVLED